MNKKLITCGIFVALVSGCSPTPTQISSTAEQNKYKAQIEENCKVSNVYFDNSSAEIKKVYHKDLECIAKVIQNMISDGSKQKIIVKLHGYSDSKGSAKFNKKLSKKRIDAVEEALHSKVDQLQMGLWTKNNIKIVKNNVGIPMKPSADLSKDRRVTIKIETKTDMSSY